VVKDRILEKLAEKSKSIGQVTIIEDEKTKWRKASTDSIAMRIGLKVEKPAPGAEELRSMSLVEIARQCLKRAHISVMGDKKDIVGRAFTHSTSDFPNILSNLANKSLLAGYDTAEETWQTWCGEGSVSDFKTNTLVRPGETDDLDEIPEGGEYIYGSRAEAKEEYKVLTYGKMFSITRQAIINDDLGALGDIPKAHGESAARKVGDLPYKVLTDNAAMGDTVALFHSDHANLGTSGALAHAKIAELIKLMRLQKDISGKRRLNIRPKFFLCPVALELNAREFLTNVVYGTQAKPNVKNPLVPYALTIVSDPRLDDNSATAYYLAGAKGKTVTVFFLDNKKVPVLETQNGWNVDGIEYKVRIDAGAKAVDWRALAKNAGA
jgi:hypothetical protein